MFFFSSHLDDTEEGWSFQKIIWFVAISLKKKSTNSARAPLATGSWLRAAAERTNVSMMELLPLTVTVSMGEVAGGWACKWEAIVAWWGEGSGCPERCGRALSTLLTDTGDKTSGWRGEAAVPEQEDRQEGRERKHQQTPINTPSQSSLQELKYSNCSPPTRALCCNTNWSPYWETPEIYTSVTHKHILECSISPHSLLLVHLYRISTCSVLILTLAPPLSPSRACPDWSSSSEKGIK